MRTLPAIFTVALVALLAACSGGPTPQYSCFRSIPASGWSRDFPLEFELAEDTTLLDGAPYDLTLVVRNTERCKLKTLWLAIQTTGIDASIRRDTVGVTLCDSLGRWKGSGSHGIYESAVVVKKNFKMTEGMDITVTLADSASEVKGISDIGILLTTSLKN